MNMQEAKYQSAKGTIERNHGDVSKFNSSELNAFFGLSKDEMNRMAKEQGVEIKRGEVSIGSAIKSYKNCYEDMCELLDYYLDLPEEHKKIISLWIIGTYMHKEFNSYPFLFFNAMRGSGKTRALNMIANLAWHGKMTNNITEAVLFRTASEHTLVIDENESIVNKEKSGLRELLNSAYKKGARVERMKKKKTEEGEQQVVEGFELYTPITMANISGMDEVLGDRCITLILEKSNNPSKTKLIEDFDENPVFEGIKRTLEANQCSFISEKSEQMCQKQHSNPTEKAECSLCSVVSLQNIKRTWNKYIKNKYTNYITTYTTHTTHTTEDFIINKNELELFEKIESLNINGRNLELFFPLICVARLIDNNIVEDVLEIAKRMSEVKKKDEYSDSPDIAVYEFISKKDPIEYYPISELLQEFKVYFVSDEGDRDWLNAKWFGRALRRLKLVVDDRRESRGMKVILDVAKAKTKMGMFKEEEDDYISR